MATTDIVFDVKTVDTQLAETYINMRSEFHSNGFTENGSYECDKFNNKVYITNISEHPIENNVTTTHSDTLDKLYSLTKMIEKNCDLFCQLEYMVRGIPADDIKKYDLKLIMDNLLYCYKTKINEEVYDNIYCDRIAFLADTPLAALGIIAQSLCCGCVNKKNCITIISNIDTAVICSLFVDLCRQVGFDEVFLQLVSKDTDCSKYNILEIKEMSTGCVGIVTNNCDVDSAVDAFLSSSVWYPWRVNKIYVQESVLERFERALAWKAEKSDEVGAEAWCSTSYRFRDKVFAVETTGDLGSGVVSLEAYRTVRELLALLGELRPLAASVWSGDVAESLEISQGLDATAVWVNDFSDFRGPPRVSQAFYSVVDAHLSARTVGCVPELNAIEALQRSWVRRDAHDREDSLQRCQKYSSWKKAINGNNLQDSFVRATENRVVTGTISPALIWRVDVADTSVDASAMIFLMQGGGLLVKSPGAESNPLFQEISKIENIPIGYESDPEMRTDNRMAKVLWRPCYRHKVIWNNYGTAFAN